MFQNISAHFEQNDEYEDVEFNKDSKLKLFIKKTFTKQKILVYIIAFMLSTIECVNGVAPFAIAIFAACCSNKIPTLIVYILTLLGTLIGLGSSQTLTYLLTSMVFVVMILLARPREQEDYENEKLKLGLYVFLSSFLVQASRNAIWQFYDIRLIIKSNDRNIIIYIL